MIDQVIYKFLFGFFKFVLYFWWFVLPLLLAQILWEKFVTYKRIQYRKRMSWGFLELKFPPGVTRNPRAMEEVFNSLHAIAPDPATELTWSNLNLKGFVPKSYSFLIIAHNGKLRFFVRYPLELKDFVKSRFYSQYPEIQFSEVDDPNNFFPPKIPNSLLNCDIFEIKLKKDDAYPIKTYSVLEYLPKEQQIDPLTTFSEAAWQISDKEWLIFQLSVLPITPDNEVHGKKWIERGQKVIDKLIGKKEETKTSIFQGLMEFLTNLLLALFREPQWKTSEEKPKEEFNIQKLTPGQRKLVELIQQKLSKFGFLCYFRAVYVAHKDVFETKKTSVFSLIDSTLKNFSTEDANAFSSQPLTFIRKYPQRSSSKRVFLMRRKEFYFFRRYRVFKGFVLNSEELASLFHPPMGFVSSAGIEKTSIKELPPSPEVPLIEL